MILGFKFDHKVDPFAQSYSGLYTAVFFVACISIVFVGIVSHRKGVEESLDGIYTREINEVISTHDKGAVIFKTNFNYIRLGKK